MPNNEQSAKHLKFDPGPIIGVVVYRAGLWEVSRLGSSSSHRNSTYSRGVIKRLSRRSINRMIFVLTATSVTFESMLVLTCPKEYPLDGKKFKSSLNSFLTFLRRSLDTDYFWFLEFQARGAPHVHIFLSLPVVGLLRKELAMAWARALGIEQERYYCDIKTRQERDLYNDVVSVHSHKRQWSCVRSKDGCIRYAAKYAAKASQKSVPPRYRNVGRFWGHNRKVINSIVAEREVDIQEGELREYLKAVNHRVADWEVLPKYIFGAY